MVNFAFLSLRFASVALASVAVVYYRAFLLLNVNVSTVEN